MRIFTFLAFIVFVFLPETGNCQTHTNPQPSVTSARQKIIDHYFEEVGVGASIYLGRMEEPYSRMYRISPYYGSSDYVQGTVTYDGVQYELPIRYDRWKEQVVVQSPNVIHNIVPAQSLISEFTVHGRHFVRFVNNYIPGAPATAFYMVLHDSPHQQLWYRPQFERKEELSGQQLNYIFYPNDRYYLVKNGNYTQIKNKNDLLKALGGTHKKEINQFIRVNNIRFDKESKAESFRAIIDYFEHLNYPG